MLSHMAAISSLDRLPPQTLKLSSGKRAYKLPARRESTSVPAHEKCRNCWRILNEAAEGVALYIEIHSQAGSRILFAMKPRIDIVELDVRHISLYWKSRNIFN